MDGLLITRSMSPDWLSNSWLVADHPQGHAILVDAGGPTEPILDKCEALGFEVTHVFCTHHHGDHVAHVGRYRERFGAQVCGHASERSLFRALDRTLEDGEEIASGNLRVRALHIPGHTVGQLAFVVNDERVFTGDTLFRGSVGGTRGPGHTTFEDIRNSIMEVLMRLPPAMPVHPGHMGITTIAQEWQTNPFIRMWRGLDRPGDAPCEAMGERGTLLLRGPDYDGGTKCWVRFDDGRHDIVPGSMTHDRP